MWDKLIVFQIFNNWWFLFLFILKYSRLGSASDRVYRLIRLFRKNTVNLTLVIFSSCRLHRVFKNACFIPLLSVNSSSILVISHTGIPTCLFCERNTRFIAATRSRCHYTFKITHHWFWSDIIIHKRFCHLLEISFSENTSCCLSFMWFLDVIFIFLSFATLFELEFSIWISNEVTYL